MCIFGGGGEKNHRCDHSKAETSIVMTEEHTKAAKAQAGDEARAVGRAQWPRPGPGTWIWILL